MKADAYSTSTRRGAARATTRDCLSVGGGVPNLCWLMVGVGVRVRVADGGLRSQHPSFTYPRPRPALARPADVRAHLRGQFQRVPAWCADAYAG